MVLFVGVKECVDLVVGRICVIYSMSLSCINLVTQGLEQCLLEDEQGIPTVQPSRDAVNQTTALLRAQDIHFGLLQGFLVLRSYTSRGMKPVLPASRETQLSTQPSILRLP